MRRIWKITLGAAASLLILVLLAIGGVWYIGLPGKSSGVERWVGAQLQSVAQSYLKPHLVLGDLKYIFPKTVVLHNVRLTADDAAHTGKTTDIMAVHTLTLTLAEIPREGQPLRIENLVLDGADIELLGGSAQAPGLVGFSDLLVQAPGAATAPTTAPATKVSDVFAIRTVEIKESRVVYDPRRAGTEAMVLDHINSTLHVASPVEGWYQVEAHIARAPISDLTVKGQLNLDTLLARIDDLQLMLQATRESEAILPPALQGFLKAHQVEGKLGLGLKGTIPLTDFPNAQLSAAVRLEQGQVIFGDRRVSVEMLTSQLSLARGMLQIPLLQVKGAGGQIQGTASFALRSPGLSQATLAIEGLRLEETVTDTAPDARRGILDANVTWQAPADQWRTASSGSGQLQIRQGRLMSLPIIKQLAQAMKLVGLKLFSNTDTADVAGEFLGDRFHLNKINLSMSVLAARGRGDILLNNTLDLKLNAGPLEKAEGTLGALGRGLGRITDQMTRYHIKGKLGDPQVNIVVGPDW